MVTRALSGSGVEQDDFVRSVVDRSGGVWIIAHYLLDEVRRGVRQPTDLDAPIRGVWHFYQSTVLGTLQKEPADLSVVALICCAAAPISIDFMVSVLDSPQHDRTGVTRIVQRWSPFLTVTDDGDARYAPYHRSFRQFVLGMDAPDDISQFERESVRGLADAAKDQHAAISDHYLRAWGGLDDGLRRARESPSVAMLDDGYGLRYLVGHLCDAGQIDVAERLVWLETTEPEPASVWWSLKARHLGLSAYRRDIDRLIDADRDPASRGHCARLALTWIHASLNSYITRLPPSVLPELVDQGRLSLDEAWANIQLLPDPESQTQALIHLASIAPDDRVAEIEAAALGSVARIESDYWRLSELVRFDRARRRTTDAAVHAVARSLTPLNQRLASRLLTGGADPASGIAIETDPVRGNQPEVVEAYLDRRQFAARLVAGWRGAADGGPGVFAVPDGLDWVSVIAPATTDEHTAAPDPRAVPIGDFRDAIWASFGRVVELPVDSAATLDRPHLSPAGEAIWQLASAVAGPGDLDPGVLNHLQGLSGMERSVVLEAVLTDVAALPPHQARAVVETLDDPAERRATWATISVASAGHGSAFAWPDVLGGIEAAEPAERKQLLAEVSAVAPLGELAVLEREAGVDELDLVGRVLRTAVASRAAELGDIATAARLMEPADAVIGPLVADAIAARSLVQERVDTGDADRAVEEWLGRRGQLPVWAWANELWQIAGRLSATAFADASRVLREAQVESGSDQDLVRVELARCFLVRGDTGSAIATAADIDGDELATRCLLDIIDRRDEWLGGADRSVAAVIATVGSAAARGRLHLAIARGLSRSGVVADLVAFDDGIDRALNEFVEWTRPDLAHATPELLSCLSTDPRSAPHLLELATHVAQVYSWWR
jgi:hypothetical protein